MEQFFTVLNTTLLLCLLLIPGFLFKKLKLGEGTFGKGLSNFILYVAQPCLLISPYIRDFDRSVLINVGVTLGFSILFHGVGALTAVLIFRNRENLTDKVYKIAVIFGNCGYMGIPLIKYIFGDAATIYATAYNIGFQFFLWTIGWYFASGDRKYMSVKKMFINPAMISIYIGILIFVLPINSYIPQIFLDGMNLLKEMVIPLSMFLVGFHMAENSFLSFFKGGKMWLCVALRLCVLPALSFCIMKLLLILGLPLDKTVATVCLIVSATPCATVTSVLAEKFDLDREAAGKLLPLSTILCVITLPLVSLLGELL